MHLKSFIGAPENESEEVIYEAMKKTYNLIHTYKDQHFYGESYQSVDEVLTFNVDNNQNLFDQLKEERTGEEVPRPDLK